MGFHILVLAGGSGTRLWPLSRGRTPKHLLPLAGGGATLLGATLERVHELGDTVHVVTSRAQAAGCADVLEAAGMDRDAIIVEPEARGTGPALALASATLARDDPDALVASVHADARVEDTDAYRAAVRASAGWALATGGLATVGLTPARPATGMGYIELGKRLDRSAWRAPRAESAGGATEHDAADLPAHVAAGMVEKPPAAVAAGWVAAGTHLWNLGLFAWPAAHFLELVRASDRVLAEGVSEVVAAQAAGDVAGADEAYAALRNVAVEPLVIEHNRLTVVHAAFEWSDLGSWSDLHDATVAGGEADADGNVVDGDVELTGTSGCTVLARSGRLVAVAGAEDLVIVDTPDALLVVPAAHAQRVKDLVDRIRAAGRNDLL